MVVKIKRVPSVLYHPTDQIQAGRYFPIVVASWLGAITLDASNTLKTALFKLKRFPLG